MTPARWALTALVALTVTGCGAAQGADRPTPPPVENLPDGVVVDYQLGGGYAPAAGVGGVVRDSTDRPAEGLYSICYVNAFQTQPDESDDWLADHPALVLHLDGAPVTDPGWPGELLLDTSTEQNRWRIAELVGARVQECAARGFDAVELDNLDSYTRSSGLLTQDDALAVARRLIATAHTAGLAVGQKNAAELAVEGHSAGFDFAVAEECHRWDECAAYTDVYGDAVIAVEYADDLRGTFADACTDPDTPASTVLRDRALIPAGWPGHVFDAC